MSEEHVASDELIHECQGLLYKAWSAAFDTLKKVKKERTDGTHGWELFHKQRLESATKEEARLAKLLKEIQPFAPLTKAKD